MYESLRNKIGTLPAAVLLACWYAAVAASVFLCWSQEQGAFIYLR